MIFRHLRRHAKLDSRVADARQRAEDATSELKLSRERAHMAREEVVRPLRRRADENKFAELLRKSLHAGYENGNRA